MRKLKAVQKEVVIFVFTKQNHMKKELRFTLFSFVFLYALQLNAQSVRLKIKSPNDMSPWSIGVGINLVEDNDRNNKSLFFNNGKLNMVPFPSVLHGSRQMNPFISLNANVSYNDYYLTVRENELTNFKRTSYLSLDVNGHFSLPSINKSMDDWLNPFLASGFGLTYRSLRSPKMGANYNIGLGAESFLTKNWSLQLTAMTKFGLESPAFKTSANHLQIQLLVKYRFDNKKKNDFSRKKYPELQKTRKYKKEE